MDEDDSSDEQAKTDLKVKFDAKNKEVFEALFSCLFDGTSEVRRGAHSLFSHIVFNGKGYDLKRGFF